MSKKQWIIENLKVGEQYAGILLGVDGDPDQHIILLPADDKKYTWTQALEAAKAAGGELPTRREQRILFANLKGQFKPEWYWSGEQRAVNSDCAWIQYFGDGSQFSFRESSQGRARAVRRLFI